MHRLLLLSSVVALAACPPAATVKPTEDVRGSPAKSAAVAEAAPQAPATAPAEDAEAADAERLRNLPPLYFALDSAQLQPESQQMLNEAAEVLRRRSNVRLRVEGHTCELGTAEYNLALGHRRAQVVRDYLVRLGVPAGAVETLSFGEEQPAESGVSEEAHARNRRSEVRVAQASQAAVSP